MGWGGEDKEDGESGEEGEGGEEGKEGVEGEEGGGGAVSDSGTENTFIRSIFCCVVKDRLLGPHGS